MSDDKIRIDVEVDARPATNALREVSNAVEDVKEETKKATLASRAWAAANADLGSAVAELRKIKDFTSSLVGAAQVGVQFMVEAERQSAALRRLGSAYEAVGAATNGAMSAQQALTLQGQIQAAGVRVNADQLGMLARAAREYALATGNDASEAVEKLTNAIVNNSADALSELGLSQARATTSTQTLANVTRELHQRFDGVAPTARTLGEDLEKLPGVINLIGNTAAQAAATGLRSFIDALRGAGTATAIWRDVTNFADDQRTLARQGVSQDAMNRRQALRERIQRQAQGVGARFNSDLLQGMSERELQSVSSRLEVGTGVRGQSARGGDLNAVFGSIVAQNDLNLNMNGQFEGIVNAVRNEERMRQRREAAGEARPVDENVRRKESIAKELANATDGVSHSFERMAKSLETSDLAAEMDRVATRSKQFASSLGSINNDLPFTVQSMAQLVNVANLNSMATGVVGADRAFRNRFQTAGNALGLAGSTDDEQSSLFGEIADSMEGGGGARRAERSRLSRIAARDRTTRRMAREQTIGGRAASSLGFATDSEGRIANFDGLKTGAELLTGTVNSLTNGLTNLFDTLVSGSADAGTAFQAFASGLLTELGKMAVNKGLFYTFEGIAALFSAPPAAPLYFAAGAGLLALGAGLGIAGAATRPQTPAMGADTSTSRNLAPRSSNVRNERALAPVTVIMSSLVPGGPRDAQQLQSGVREAQRRGFAGGMLQPRQVEH